MLTKSTVVPLKIEIQMNAVFSYTITINLTAGIRQNGTLRGATCYHGRRVESTGRQKVSGRHMRLESI